MRKFYVLSVLFVLFFPNLLSAQEKVKENKFGYNLSGYVKTDIFYDTRQVDSWREGHFLLYPLNVSPDKDGADINAKSSFNMLNIQTRLTLGLYGPDVLNAKTTGLIEGEFFGSTDATINCFRLRHAYLKLNWEHSELLIGQTWHPIFNVDCFPNVVSVNTGAPFQPFSRNPQVRYTYSTGFFKILAAAMSQRDFSSPGGSTSLRNAVLPDLYAQAQFSFINAEKKTGAMFGFGGGYKMLQPRLVTDSGYKTNSKIGGYYGDAYLQIKTKPITIELHGVLGQNLYNLTMLGGYAVKYDTIPEDIKKNELQYTTINNASAWIEIASNTNKFQVALFAGYSYNLGSLNNIQNWTSSSSYFCRGNNILYAYRIAPRFVYNPGKLRFGLEPEYTVAAYGKTWNSLDEVANVTPVANLRILLGVFYFF